MLRSEQLNPQFYLAYYKEQVQWNPIVLVCPGKSVGISLVTKLCEQNNTTVQNAT